MSEVRSPGFNAYAAVYPTARHYRTMWSPADSRTSLSAALSIPVPHRPVTGPLGPVPGPMGRKCDPTCLCVVPEGCPCCEVIAPRQPFMREASTRLTCEPGSESTCMEWCDHAGGGLSSNPDGSTTCTVYS
jgi:hypothetical protein